MEIRPLKLGAAAGIFSLALCFIMLAPLSAGAFSISYDFNDGFQNWEPQNGSHLEWVVREVPRDAHPTSFSLIDPDDVASLTMEVPQSSAQRSKGTVTSPEIELGNDASLQFYVGYNSWYDSLCRLLLQVSADNFATSVTLWNSKNFKTDGWSWNKHTVDLSEFANSTVRFRFFYTTGSTDVMADRGGFSGDFAIDNFTLTFTPPKPSDPNNPNNPEDPGIDDTDPEQPGVDDPGVEEPDPDYPNPDTPGVDDPDEPGIDDPDPEQPGIDNPDPDPDEPGVDNPDNPEDPKDSGIDAMPFKSEGVIYNYQGVRISGNAPLSPGFYIRIEAGKATKFRI